MQDIYETTILCDKCNKPTTKSYAIKDNFKIRLWSCPICKKKWYHPTDIENYNHYKEIKNKNFEVKLRPVGNSWTISIPKEIIKFEEIQKTKIIKMSMQEPGKLTIFLKRIRKVY